VAYFKSDETNNENNLEINKIIEMIKKFKNSGIFENDELELFEIYLKFRNINLKFNKKKIFMSIAANLKRVT